MKFPIYFGWAASMVVLAGAAGAASATAPGTLPGIAQAPAPALDLEIHYYSKVLTPEGVSRESRYQEMMLRRPGHVWSARILPAATLEPKPQDLKQKVALNVEKTVEKHAETHAKTHAKTHAEFNHVVLPRHVALENGKLQVTFIDAKARQVVSIPAAEYDNVNFDGSWENAYYLIDPKSVNALPVSQRPSPIAGAVWHEREKNGIFERVLWDAQKQIPLIIESGNKTATFYHRIEVKLQTSARTALPWLSLKGYGQKEYSDFLD